MTNLYFVLCIWGSNYIKFWNKYALPSLLSKNNLPKIKGVNKIFIIWTYQTDAKKIFDSKEFHILSKICKVQLKIIPLKISNKYFIMNFCHNSSYEYIRPGIDVICFLSPDAVASDGLLGNSFDKINSGYLSVLVAGPSANKDQSLKSLTQIVKKRNGIQSRKLVEIWMKNKSNLAKSHFISGNSTKIQISPSYFYFKNTKTSVLSRQFHLHPLFVKPKTKVAKISGTFDLSFVQQSVGKFEDIFIIKDSDFGFYCEFSSEPREPVDSFLNQEFYRHMSDFLVNSTWTFNRLYIWENILFHSKEDKISAKATQQADLYIKKIFAFSFESTISGKSILDSLLENPSLVTSAKLMLKALDWCGGNQHVLLQKLRVKKIYNFFKSKYFIRLLCFLKPIKGHSENALLHKDKIIPTSVIKSPGTNKTYTIFYYNSTELERFWVKNYKNLSNAKLRFKKIKS